MKSARFRWVIGLAVLCWWLFGVTGAWSQHQGAEVIDGPTSVGRSNPAPAELFADHPFTMAPDADLAELLKNPTKISFAVDTSPPSPATTSTLGDLHAVYPVSLAAMRETITDYNNYPEFAPRVTQSDAVRTGEDPVTYRQRLTLSFRVLFFGSDYDYYLTVTETPVCRVDGVAEFGMHYRMQESLDGRLSDVEGSWYLRAVEIDGVEHTYARYFNSIFFAEDQFGLRLALRNLGARDLKNTMDAMYREAERRSQAGDP